MGRRKRGEHYVGRSVWALLPVVSSAVLLAGLFIIGFVWVGRRRQRRYSRLPNSERRGEHAGRG